MRSGLARPGSLHVFTVFGCGGRGRGAARGGMECGPGCRGALRGRPARTPPSPPRPSPPPPRRRRPPARPPGPVSPPGAGSSSARSRLCAAAARAVCGCCCGRSVQRTVAWPLGREFSGEPIPFVGLVSGCRELGGGSRTTSLRVALGGRGRRAVTQPARRLHPS